MIFHFKIDLVTRNILTHNLINSSSRRNNAHFDISRDLKESIIIHKANILKLRNEDQMFMHVCPCSMPAMVRSVPTTGNLRKRVRRECDITRLNSSDSKLIQLEFIASNMVDRDI